MYPPLLAKCVAVGAPANVLKFSTLLFVKLPH